MQSHSFIACILIALTPAISAQCNTDQNPYCKGNSKLESICCPYPNVCYWADRKGTPACCPAGQVCLDWQGITVEPQPDITIVEPPPQPSTVYTTVTPQPVTQTTYIQPSQQTQTTYVNPCTECEPQTVTVVESQQQWTQPQTQQPTVVTTTTTGGVVGSIGSEIVATGSSFVNVFQGAAPTARPNQCAVPMVGAMAVVAAWQLG